MRLYRVYLHTNGDHSVHELVVVADSEADAEIKALKHVKAGNKGKGERTKAQSEKLTTVLSVKTASKKYCLEVHSFPISVFQELKEQDIS
jgi:hypothetical protein